MRLPPPRIPRSITAQCKPVGPLVLVYSPREKLRDIVSVGLIQSDYRVIKAESPHVALIKAFQFLPDVVIVDVTADHTRDVLLVPRLHKSARGADIALLVVLSPRIRELLQKILTANNEPQALAPCERLDIIEYPFNFGDLLKKVLNLAAKKPAEIVAPTESEEEQRRNRIARELFDREIPAEKKIRAVEQTINRQWAFPFAVIKALDIIESSASCCAELASCIATDPGAASAILRLANTIPYAKRAKTVTTISEAVVRLGFRETRNLLACLALIDLSPEVEKRYGFSRKEFWLHSLATAIIAERLTGSAGHRRPELAFIAGLVHDIGKIPLDNIYQRVFSFLLEETANQVTAFHETERRLLDFTHADLGHFLALRWNFPSVLSQAILNHHQPERIQRLSIPIDRMVAEAVFAANIIAKAISAGHSCDDFLDEIPPAVLRELNIPNGPDEQFLADIHRRLRLMCSHLNVATHTLGPFRAQPEKEATELIVVAAKSNAFHPVLLALRSSGFAPRVVQQYDHRDHSRAKIVLSVSERGCPIDVTLEEDAAKASSAAPILRVFLVDSLPDEELMQGFEESKILFLNRKHLNTNLLLHTLDRFLEKVIVPPVVENESEGSGEPPAADTPWKQ